MKASSQARNEYRCTVEVNQGGKYCVRIRAFFPKHNWVLSVYFLASSFNRAIKKMETALQFLQRDEDRLWFWGVDRSDDPSLPAELLEGAGLSLDRRAEFPRKAATIQAPQEQPVAAFLLAPARRHLAESIETTHAARAATASD